MFRCGGKLLGLQITSDMKWKANTSCMINKANMRLWILRRLKILGADTNSLVDVYIKPFPPVVRIYSVVNMDGEYILP